MEQSTVSRRLWTAGHSAHPISTSQTGCALRWSRERRHQICDRYHVDRGASLHAAKGRSVAAAGYTRRALRRSTNVTAIAATGA
jgi:hypothetical protein